MISVGLGSQKIRTSNARVEVFIEGFGARANPAGGFVPGVGNVRGFI